MGAIYYPDTRVDKLLSGFMLLSSEVDGSSSIQRQNE